MSGPPPRQRITATDRQRAVLEQIIRGTSSPQQLVARAKLVLGAAAGENNARAGRLAGVSRETARQWRGRWAAAGEALLAAEAEGDDRALEAVLVRVLADESRPGAPAIFTPEQLCQIMALACTPPQEVGRPIERWTPRELADEAIARGIVASISATSVGRFLKGGRAQAAPQPLLAHPSAR